MMRRMAASLAVAFCMLPAAARAGSCAPAGSEGDVPQVLTSMYASVRTDDEAGFRQAVTSDFYAFDNGKPFEGVALFQLVKAAHAAGRRFEWSVTEPRVTMVCDIAFVAYINKGAVGDTSGMKPTTWLESALVRYQDGRWRVAFLHSDRASP